MTEYWQKQAHQLANRFTKEKVPDFMHGFMQESGLLAILREKGVLPKMKEKPDLAPWEHYFGKWIALTYALGYLDGIEKQKVVQIFVPPKDAN